MAWLMMLGGGRQPRCLKEEKAASEVGIEGAGVQKDKSCEFPKEKDQIQKHQEPLHSVRSLCTKTSQRKLDK